MTKKALITGINGFVGPHLKNELEKNGYEIFGIDLEDIEKDNYYSVDITDKEKMKEVLNQIKPTHIFHLAAISSLAYSEKNPDLTYNVNVEGTRNLLELALDLNSPPKILVVSSVYVYGHPKYLPIDEKHDLSGIGAYVNSKIKQEEVCREYFDKLSIIVTRSFNHTGDGQLDLFVIPKIVKGIIEIKRGDKDFLELGDKEIKRDITDVRDVVRAYRLLLEQDKKNIICNVCRGESISLKKVINYVGVIAQLEDIDVRVNPDFVRKNDVKDLYGDNSYLKSIIDWKVDISYEDMISDLYNNLIKN